jgi:hypothetical protein
MANAAMTLKTTTLDEQGPEELQSSEQQQK